MLPCTLATSRLWPAGIVVKGFRDLGDLRRFSVEFEEMILGFRESVAVYWGT